jgi:hypothetical protein
MPKLNTTVHSRWIQSGLLACFVSEYRIHHDISSQERTGVDTECIASAEQYFAWCLDFLAPSAELFENACTLPGPADYRCIINNAMTLLKLELERREMVSTDSAAYYWARKLGGIIKFLREKCPVAGLFLLVDGRQLFVTEDGQLGTVEADVQPGDLVGHVVGASRPIVVRRSRMAAKYELVGAEAFVHGIKDGGNWAVDVNKLTQITPV